MNKQIELLANYLMEHNLAPKGDESACEGAIRVIKSLRSDLGNLKMHMATESTHLVQEINKLREEKVTVCAACLRVACWDGLIQCDDYLTAGTIEILKSEVKK